MARRAPYPGETARSRQVEPGSDGDLIARCRHQLNLSARGLAENLGADPRTVTRWEGNEFRVPNFAWMGLFLLLYLHLDGVSKATARRYHGNWREGVGDLLAAAVAADLTRKLAGDDAAE